jgi:probable rRNA maturation factor
VASRRTGSRRRRKAEPSARLARVARQVLAWERAGRARVELTLLGGAAMRRLNRRATGRRGLTDVIAFALPQPDGTLVGDVYICPDAARRWLETVARPTSHVARPTSQAARLPRGQAGDVRRVTGDVEVEEELIRLAVHGTLHVLGYDHAAGPGRTRSAMWRRQERYVRRLLNGRT